MPTNLHTETRRVPEMQQLIQQLLLGVSLGAIYALIALSFTTIFQGTKVFNLAQGGVMLLGVLVASLVAPTAGFWVGVAAGIGAGVAVTLLIWLLTSIAKGASHLSLTILTIGVEVVLISELTRRIGSDFLQTRDPWGAATWEVLGVRIPEARVWAIVVTAVLVAAFFWAFRSTAWGSSMRASSADPLTAELLGISERRVGAAAWAIGGALAVVAGVFLAGAPNPGLDYTSYNIAFAAIPAVVIGGLDSSEGAVIGGFVVGITQGLVTGYSDHLGFLGSELGTVTPYVLMMLVLLVRPNGLFGSKEVARV